MAVRETGIPLFIETLDTIPAGFSKLLSDYCGIASAKQHDHILQLRDRAYKHYPYPCLGRWRFLDLDLSVHPLYHRVLEILSNDLRTSDAAQTVFLDLGCCLGQDLRKLVSDLPSITEDDQTPYRHAEIAKKVFGADLRPEFIQLGYELFDDKDTFPKQQFIAPADVFDMSLAAPLASLDGKVSVLNCTAVFHLFGLEEQKKVAHRCLKLLNRSGIQGKYGKKALLLGAQVANVTPSEYPRRSGGSRYRHNDESWKGLWEEVVKSEDWKYVVRGVEVGSQLQEGRMDSKGKYRFGQKMDPGEAENVTEPAGVERSKMIGALEAGFRWQVWWVWVEFY